MQAGRLCSVFSLKRVLIRDFRVVESIKHAILIPTETNMLKLFQVLIHKTTCTNWLLGLFQEKELIQHDLITTHTTLYFKNTPAEIISSHCAHSSGVIFKPIQFDLSSARNGLVIACILRDLCDIFMMSLRCYFYLYYMYFYKSTSAYDCTEHIPPCQGKTFLL